GEVDGGPIGGHPAARDEDAAVGGRCRIDADRETKNVAVLNEQLGATVEPDAVGARAVEPVDAQIAQDHGIACARADVDAWGLRYQNTGDLAAAAVNRDRLGDCDGAEPAWVERIDLAACRGLRNGSGEGLARRGTAAR